MKYLLSCLLLLTSQFALANPSVTIDTNHGKIVVELYQEQAPKTVANFLKYVKNDAYANSTFHRVIKDFMIQGGGFSTTGQRLSTYPAITNEAKNGLKNDRGTIAMARTGNPHSATRQFFINHVNNDFLNNRGQQWGYAVFGKVTSGMEVVDEIAAVATGYQDKPRETVIIEKISLNPVQQTEPAK